MTRGPRLLIRLGSLGDVVLATAVASAWKRRLGDAPLDVLVKPEYAPIWAGHPAVRDILVWPVRDRNVSGVRRWARRLRGIGYVAAVDLQASPRTRALTALAGIPVLGRPRRHALRRRLLVHLHRWGPPRGYSVLQSFLDAVDPAARDLPQVTVTDQDRERARARTGPEPPLALVPGARHATKRWPLERFAATAGLLLPHMPVCALFGPDDAEAARRWSTLAPRAAPALQEPLATVAAVLEWSRAAVTGDTGLMHLAAAVGTPVVALFGPTVPAFGFAPAGDGHRVLERELSCRPCSVHGGPRCPRGHHRCLHDITPDEVGRAVRELGSPAAVS